MLDRKVQYFITVVEEKSFSKAAKKLFLSQPNLSKQVKLLEEDLGVKLLNREGYRPVLTPVGEYYYHEIKKLQESVEELQEQLKAMEQKEIRIGFTGSFENRRILEAFKEIKSQTGQIRLDFIKCSFEDSSRYLRNKEIDISFGVESNFWRYPEIEYEVLYAYEMCVICSFDHPFAKYDVVMPEMLKDQEMIVLSKKNGIDFYNDFMAACKMDGLILRKKKEVNTFDELVFEVSTGNGVAVVAKEVVREGEVKIVEFKDTHHSSRYVIATLKQNQDKAVKELVDNVKDYFQGTAK